MPTIRAFIAIELPVDIQQKLDNIIHNLQAMINPTAIRWVNARNIHLTIKFLGEIPLSSVDPITQNLIAETNRHPGFEMSLGGLGVFPNFHRPRIIWVGLTTPTELLILQKGIEKEVNKMGIPFEDHPFSPHLTLGRISPNASPVLTKQIGEIINTFHIEKMGSFSVSNLVLFRSDLTPAGAIYTRLATASLSR
jgi:2'-5' RNA ligase